MGKAEIVAAAYRLYCEKGYEATSMEAIAREVGIKKASLYFHYNGKETLFRELICGKLMDYSVRAAALSEGLEPSNLEKGLREITRRYMNYFQDPEQNQFWYRLYVAPPAFMKEEMPALMLNAESGFISGISAYFAIQLERENIKSFPIDVATTAFYSLIVGLALSAAYIPQEGIEAMIEASLTVFLRGLANE